MELTHEWQEYDMDYQKAVQDIRTKDGNEYENCWPNAGKWNVMGKSDRNCIQIPDTDVTHVKLNKSWMSDAQEESAEKKQLEKQRGILITSLGTIGHIDHGNSSALLAARRILADMNRKDLVLIDENNLEEVKTRLMKERTFEIRNTPYIPDIPDIPIIEYKGQLQYKKSHKVNKTPLSLGSYKFKSKKK